MRTTLAWMVHAYTALGLVIAAVVAILIVDGSDHAIRWAFVLLGLAVLVDSTDGLFARRARVKEILPSFDGRRLDDIIDFHTYVSLPVFLLWRAAIPGEGFSWVLLLPLFASAYGFSQTDAKTDDGYFKGFPSCWNGVAFYLYFFAPPDWVSILALAGFSFLTFLPTPYLYPTTGGPAARTMLALGAVWAGIALAIALGLVANERGWLLVSALIPAAYLVTSWAVSIARAREMVDGLEPE